MKITRDTVVALDVEITDLWDNPLQHSEEPLVYLHGGYGGILPKLESALEGKRPGEGLTMDLEPEDAFGEYDENLLRVEGRERFPETLEVGMQFEGMPGEAPDDTIYTVTDIADEKVVLDGNDPLAGIALRFKLRVVEVRPAAPDEIERGYAVSGAAVLVRPLP